MRDDTFNDTGSNAQMPTLAEQIKTYLAANPHACSREIEKALNCSRSSVSLIAKRIGVKLRHSGARQLATTIDMAALTHAAETAAGAAVARALTAELTRMVRGIVDQWLTEHAPTRAPTDAQVVAVMNDVGGVALVTRALASNGYAAVFSALHRNHAEVLRKALMSPREIEEKTQDADMLGMRFANVMGGSGGQIAHAFLAAMGLEGRRELAGFIKQVVSTPATPAGENGNG